MLYSHADWLRQALYVLAVTVNAVAQVGGGAGIVRAAVSRRVSAGEERVLRVEGGRALALVPPLAFASLLLSLISVGM